MQKQENESDYEFKYGLIIPRRESNRNYRDSGANYIFKLFTECIVW